jgi:hypothetical protein
MPSSAAIVDQLAAVANEWVLLAVFWHAVLGVGGLAVYIGWRPSQRLTGALLVPPLASVAGLAWSSGNPFNGLVFLAAATIFAALAARLSRSRVELNTGWTGIAGSILLAFAWVYPHFLHADFVTSYFYAAPLGLIPCPTLSAMIGVSLVMGLYEARAWARLLAVFGLFYGIVGVVSLGVQIDAFLLAGAALLAGFGWGRYTRDRTRATDRLPSHAVAGRL